MDEVTAAVMTAIENGDTYTPYFEGEFSDSAMNGINEAFGAFTIERAGDRYRIKLDYSIND